MEKKIHYCNSSIDESNTFKLLDGDLKTAGPSLNDPVRAMLSPSAVGAVGFQLIPLSCMAFAASVMMTY